MAEVSTEAGRCTNDLDRRPRGRRPPLLRHFDRSMIAETQGVSGFAPPRQDRGGTPTPVMSSDSSEEEIAPRHLPDGYAASRASCQRGDARPRVRTGSRDVTGPDRSSDSEYDRRGLPAVNREELARSSPRWCPASARRFRSPRGAIDHRFHPKGRAHGSAGTGEDASVQRCRDTHARRCNRGERDDPFRRRRRPPPAPSLSRARPSRQGLHRRPTGGERLQRPTLLRSRVLAFRQEQPGLREIRWAVACTR